MPHRLLRRVAPRNDTTTNILLCVLSSVLLFCQPAFSAEFQSEVLSVKGLAIVTDTVGADRGLKPGDLLKKGDEVSVGDDSYVDLAYDKDWQNVTRLESNTLIKITSVMPGKLDLKNGAIFAKLKKLPRDSEFEVKTPTAVASVRGTEYLTKHVKGQTEVLNASSSPIFVYGFLSDGSVDKDTEVILETAGKTIIAEAGQAPEPPIIMTDEEQAAGQALTQAIQTNIEEAEREGRRATIQTVEEIETFIKKAAEDAKPRVIVPPSESSQLSRVTDTRRRAFGGQKALAPPEAAPEPESAPEEPPQEENA